MAITQEEVIVKLTADNAKLKAALRDSEKSVNNFTRVASRAMGILTIAYVGAKSAQGLVKYSDAWSNLTAQLKLSTSTTKEFITAQKELFSIAQEARTPIESVTTLYSKMQRSTKDLGTSQQDLLRLTKTISEAMIVSGASTTEANSALLQLGQGMASGVLRGEELNSIMENTPRLAQAIADGMGVAIGDLRTMGAEGKLTADSIIYALKGQAEAIDSEFKQIPITVSQSLTNLKNSSLKIIGELSQAFGTTGGLASIINTVSNKLIESKENLLVFGSFGSVILSRMADLFTALFYSAKAFGLVISKDMEGANEAILQAQNSMTNFLSVDVVEAATAKLNEANQAVINIGKSSSETKEKSKEMTDVFIYDIAVAKIKMDEYRETIKGVGSILTGSLSQGFRDAMDGANNFGKMFENILKDIVAYLIQVLVIQKAVNAALGWSGAGNYSDLPNLGQMGIQTGGYTGYAKGGAFEGGIQKFASGGVVSTPKYFSMAGNKTGLMGEAGAEAIVPLTRAPNGDLGVKTSPVNITVVNNNNSDVQVHDDGMGQIEVIINKISNDITRGVGSIGQALERRYNLSKA